MPKVYLNEYATSVTATNIYHRSHIEIPDDFRVKKLKLVEVGDFYIDSDGTIVECKGLYGLGYLRIVVEKIPKKRKAFYVEQVIEAEFNPQESTKDIIYYNGKYWKIFGEGPFK